MKPEEFIGALRRAERGEEPPDPFLLRYMDAYPERWADYGDVAKPVQKNWLKLLYTRNGLARESTQPKLAAVVRQMVGENPSPLEMLLAGRITALQIQVSVYRCSVHRNRRPGSASTNCACRSWCTTERSTSTARPGS